jgi:hypothetical protein
VSGRNYRVPLGAPCSCKEAAVAAYRGDPGLDDAVHDVQRALGVAERIGPLACPELRARSRRCIEIAALLHERGVACRVEIAATLMGIHPNTVSHDFRAMGEHGFIVDPNWDGEKRKGAYVGLTPKGRARLNSSRASANTPAATAPRFTPTVARREPRWVGSRAQPNSDRAATWAATTRVSRCGGGGAGLARRCSCSSKATVRHCDGRCGRFPLRRARITHPFGIQ